MTDQDAVRADIAFVRALAEQGRGGPLVGGPILVACGLIYGAASLANWWILNTTQQISGLAFPAIWFGATAVFLICLRLLKARARSLSGAAAQAAGLGWMTSGWATFTISIGLMIVSYRMNDWLIMAALPSIILALYGAAWLLGAMLSRQAWVFAVAGASFLMALVNAWWAVDYKHLYLIFAVSLLTLLTAPGLVMMRQARKAAV
jgi:hypothetical protein